VACQSRQRDTAVKFLKASFKGWIYCRDNPEPCVDIVLKSDAKLPKGHQTWQLNEVNGIIWPAPNGIGITDEARVQPEPFEVATAGKILTKPVEGKGLAQRPRPRRRSPSCPTWTPRAASRGRRPR
jgi:NitT/TauT family transport system substrate-binding protein